MKEIWLLKPFFLILFVYNSVNLLDKIHSLILKQNKMSLFSFSCPDIFIMICDHLHWKESSFFSCVIPKHLIFGFKIRTTSGTFVCFGGRPSARASWQFFLVNFKIAVGCSSCGNWTNWALGDAFNKCIKKWDAPDGYICNEMYRTQK